MSKSQAVERKLFYTAAGWLTGLAGYVLFPTKAFIAAAAGVIILAAALFVFKRLDRCAVNKLLIVFAAFTLAMLHIQLYVLRTAEPLRSCGGRIIAIRGVVTDIRKYESSCYITVKGRMQNNGIKTSISFPVSEEDISGLTYGDEVSAAGRVRIPANTLTFDKEDYNRSLGIFLEGEEKTKLKLLQKRRDPLLYAMKSARTRAIEKIRNALPGQEGAFLTAVLCSDKTALDSVTSSAIYRAGLGHLFAVSGTHIVILSSFISFLLNMLRAPRKLSSLLLIVFLICFAVFAGCTPSVVRACIMSGISLTGAFFNRRSDSSTSLGIAAILITLNCPYAIESISFMLSFTASLAIGTVAPAICRGRIESTAYRSVISIISIGALSAPICVMRFSEVSLIHAAANLLLVPLCSACLGICFVYLITGCLLTPLLRLAGLVARFVIALCRLATNSPLSFAGTFQRGRMLTIAVIAAAVYVVCALIRSKRAVIFACVTAYIFQILCFAMADRFPKPDQATVYPQKWSATVVVGSGDDVIIFDSGGLRFNAYAVARLTEQRHPQRVFLYTLKERPQSVEALVAQCSDLTDYCFIDSPHGIADSGGADNARFEDGELIVTVNGSELHFGKNSMIVDGEEYIYTRFTDISTFAL